jgi:hypothetical protein
MKVISEVDVKPDNSTVRSFPHRCLDQAQKVLFADDHLWLTPLPKFDNALGAPAGKTDSFIDGVFRKLEVSKSFGKHCLELGRQSDPVLLEVELLSTICVWLFHHCSSQRAFWQQVIIPFRSCNGLHSDLKQEIDVGKNTDGIQHSNRGIGGCHLSQQRTGPAPEKQGSSEKGRAELSMGEVSQCRVQ